MSLTQNSFLSIRSTTFDSCLTSKGVCILIIGTSFLWDQGVDIGPVGWITSFWQGSLCSPSKVWHCTPLLSTTLQWGAIWGPELRRSLTVHATIREYSMDRTQRPPRLYPTPASSYPVSLPLGHITTSGGRSAPGCTLATKDPRLPQCKLSLSPYWFVMGCLMWRA